MSSFTKQELLKYVQEFSVAEPPFRVWTLTFGEHKSKQTGEGIEFKEYRPYSPGEDVQNLDMDETLRAGEPMVRDNLTEEKVRYVILLDDSLSLKSYGMRETALLSLGCYLASAVKERDPAQAIVIRGNVKPYVSPKIYGMDDVVSVLLELWDMPCAIGHQPSTLKECSSVSSQTISLANTRLLFVSDFLFRDAKAVYDRKSKTMVFEGRDILRSAVGSTFAGGVVSTEITFLGVSPDWKNFQKQRGFFRYQDQEDSSLGLVFFPWKKSAQKFVRLQYERERVWQNAARLSGIPMAWVHATSPQSIIKELERQLSG